MTYLSAPSGANWNEYGSMKIYSQNIGKIWAKINIHDHTLLIFFINFINILAKTIKYKKSFNGIFSITVCPIWLKFDN